MNAPPLPSTPCPSRCPPNTDGLRVQVWSVLMCHILECHHHEPHTSPDRGAGSVCGRVSNGCMRVWASLLFSLLAWSFIMWIIFFQMERVRRIFPCLKLNIIKLKYPPQPLRLHPSKLEATGGGRQGDRAPWTHVDTLTPSSHPS